MMDPPLDFGLPSLKIKDILKVRKQGETRSLTSHCFVGVAFFNDFKAISQHRQDALQDVLSKQHR